MAGCIKIKDGYSKALELIQDLQLKRLRMDDVIYGAILAVCASSRKWLEAELYFKQMKDEGLSPNHYHYSSLLNAYSACGDHNKAHALVQDMKSAGLVPNKVCFSLVIDVSYDGILQVVCSHCSHLLLYITKIWPRVSSFSQLRGQCILLFEVSNLRETKTCNDCSRV